MVYKPPTSITGGAHLVGIYDISPQVLDPGIPIDKSPTRILSEING
jgi:hypothetical protein